MTLSSSSILGVFARQPAAGQVKTRLAEDIGAEAATRIYEACLAAILESTAAIATERVISFSPGTDEARGYFERHCTCPGDRLWPQPDLSLGGRLAAFVEEFGSEERPLVLIGSDSPTLPADYLHQAFDVLGKRDVVVGPAFDGGYFLIGMRGQRTELFDAIEWGGPHVFHQTLDRIRSANLTLHVLPPWYDVDRIESLRFLETHLEALRLAGQLQSGALASLAAVLRTMPIER